MTDLAAVLRMAMKLGDGSGGRRRASLLNGEC